MILRCLITLGLLFSYDTLAYQPKSMEDCEKFGKASTEYSKCLDIVKETTSRELQTWINNQTFILEEFAIVTGRRSALEMFKRSQRNFITYRENNCRWQYLHISPAKEAPAAFKKCYIMATRNRIVELAKLDSQ